MKFVMLDLFNRNSISAATNNNSDSQLRWFQSVNVFVLPFLIQTNTEVAFGIYQQIDHQFTIIYPYVPIVKSLSVHLSSFFKVSTSSGLGFYATKALASKGGSVFLYFFFAELLWICFSCL